MSATDTVVVAAQFAWPEYKAADAYICQPNRSFQPFDYIAFYHDMQICARVPKVIEDVGIVRYDPELYGGRIREVLQKLIACKSPREIGSEQRLFLLSPWSHADTIRLPAPIKHLRDGAWTQYQRYISSDALRIAKTTDDLT